MDLWIYGWVCGAEIRTRDLVALFAFPLVSPFASRFPGNSADVIPGRKRGRNSGRERSRGARSHSNRKDSPDARDSPDADEIASQTTFSEEYA